VRHWAVLFLGTSLERADPVYHEYGGSPGTTACGRRWYISLRVEADSVPATWVRRDNAEKFARACGHCSPDTYQGAGVSDHADTIREALSKRFLAPEGTPWAEIEKYEADAYTALDALAARYDALENALREIRVWFEEEPWRGAPSPGDFGGHSYSKAERAIGYGTYRDPRFLPAALAATDTTRPDEKDKLGTWPSLYGPEYDEGVPWKE
jgi:hypothetical protein